MAAFLARPTASRAVHIRIAPRPSNLGESRAILRLLDARFGSVEYFKSFRHDRTPTPHSAILIFREAASAQELLRQSPFRFRLGRRAGAPEGKAAEGGKTASSTTAPAASPSPPPPPPPAPSALDPSLPRGPLGTPFGLGNILPPPSSRGIHTTAAAAAAASSSTPPSSPADHFLPFSLPNQTNDSRPAALTPEENHFSYDPFRPSGKLFQIQADHSFRNFRDRIDEGAYHARYALDSKQTGQHDLIDRVPLPGLSCLDWRRPARPWHIVRRDHRDRDREGEDPRVAPRTRLSELVRRARERGAGSGEEGGGKEGG